MVHCKSTKPQLHHGLDNKRPASVVATLHCTVPFCIALCSIELFGSVVEHGLVLDFDVDGG